MEYRKWVGILFDDVNVNKIAIYLLIIFEVSFKCLPSNPKKTPKNNNPPKNSNPKRNSLPRKNPKKKNLPPRKIKKNQTNNHPNLKNNNK